MHEHLQRRVVRSDPTHQVMDDQLVPIGTPPPLPNPNPAMPVPAINHNVRHDGREVHIQTEDLGPRRKRITTCLFVGGAVVASRSIDYEDLTDRINTRKVRKGMQEQHKALLRRLVRGELASAITDASTHSHSRSAGLRPGKKTPQGTKSVDRSARSIRETRETRPAPELIAASRTPDLAEQRSPWWIRSVLLRVVAPVALAAAAVVGVVYLYSPPEAAHPSYAVAAEPRPVVADIVETSSVTEATKATKATNASEVKASAETAQASIRKTPRSVARPAAKRPAKPRIDLNRSKRPAARTRSIKRRSRALVVASRRALARRDYELARTKARAALQLDRRNRSARKLQRLATSKLKKRRAAVRRTLASARRAYKARKYRLARKRARAVLRLDRRNRSARKLSRLASRKLRSRS